ncbi:hypothetical protein DDB_G0281299 [Dictyostelium discoideum AX4]|uniref:Carbohydrate binding domain-containing protein n=1 Tax=Dictyostelium discoideum TaxID=44689 RepID=Q54UH4_DICDI|nr:hypothetical protein DDB_G0281299 [Dictyostelium discoideum AX4]EAL66946.1 hypothetical protein DDB_G0281299 [Dictyostelium discoideum AX4]|eukprot:XP_640802.1 hypothetical protein DDB_G0281299 [Dictyostelium discoideum AX4]
MKVSILFVLIIFLLFSSLFTFSLCKHDDNDDYDIKVNTKVKDQGDEITVKVIIKNNHDHDHEHQPNKELDDIQDDKANRCKGFNINNNSSDIDGSGGDISNDSNGDNENNEENAKSLHNQSHHHRHYGRDICGCKFGRYGKDCRKRELEYQNSFIQCIWEVETLLSSNDYQLPNWVGSISSGSSHSFGYIQQSNQTTPLTDETSTCDELPTPTPTTPTSSCNANVTQTITSSWRENNQDYIQVETIITNIGQSMIQSYTFELNDIQSIWEVQKLSNTFTLPNWKNSIEVGSSHTFGYIQKAYSINPLLSVNKVCQESSSSSSNITTDNKPPSKSGLL